MKKKRKKKKIRSHVLGQPLKFSTPQDLQKVVNKYFKDTPREIWTVSGIALIMGSHQLVQDYKKRAGYSDIIIRATLMVEQSYEISLRKHGRSGDIFALKNFGWRDTQYLDAKVEETLHPEYKNWTNAEILAEINRISNERGNA